MAEVKIGNFEENAKLFEEMIMPEEEEHEEEVDGDVKVKIMKVDSGDMRGMMDEILGHGSPKVM